MTEQSWIEWIEGRDTFEQLPQFFAEHLPSQPHREPWICIRRKFQGPSVTPAEDLRSVVQEIDQTPAPLSPEAIKQFTERILRASADVCGKWMLFPTAGQVDHVWHVIASAVLGGLLGHCAKVSTNQQPFTGKPNRFVVCIYIPDYRDEASVFESLKKIMSLSPVRVGGGFKPDVFTQLGMYSTVHNPGTAAVCRNLDLLPKTIYGWMKRKAIMELKDQRRQQGAQDRNPMKDTEMELD